ncbi:MULTISPECIES: peptide deformylase [unclassified Staphylococcus]|uniref:peptide deformylase n=1 Tax=unclassified Staphylococcus TaxID=91994 RepID=UPI0021CF7B3B|nr:MULTISPECIES: peptide deformylase [unclassified Staphylococcus]UXR70348.1 peptide deformylase [Staphylococcus sp. IVB6246]UXR72414.1 peptide deformylase [Staphylococcus sp. IVB6240]UXR74718.1 peptide deformylase [Staphylococcus sp. IVB6238]UXR77051.1 peptide deformylase [Staphylococcus sp. IVB6233]UXR81176.1 peptide deformylase [Staphylococcus sp. IVB6218]
MAVKKILNYRTSNLRQKTEPVSQYDEKLTSLIEDLEDTMYEMGSQAIAAPQIGVNQQVALIDMGQDGLLQLINPEISSASSEMATELEGCMSVPGRYGEVERSRMIVVKSNDLNGNQVELTAYDDIARMILHEMDTLNGILFIDKMHKEVTEDELEAYLEDE